MKVTLSLGQLVSSTQVLALVAGTKMPVKTSYRLNKLLRKVSKEVEIYNEERGKIFEEYGEEETPGTLVIPKEKSEVAEKAINELLDQEIEMDLPDVTVDMLAEGGLEISPLDMQLLEPLLNTTEDVVPPP